MFQLLIATKRDLGGSTAQPGSKGYSVMWSDALSPGLSYEGSCEPVGTEIPETSVKGVDLHEHDRDCVKLHVDTNATDVRHVVR